MKKIVFLFALVASFAANASYLFWQVDRDTADQYEASQAILWGNTGNGYEVVESANIGTVTSSQLTGTEGSYYIELYSYNNGSYDVVAKGEAFTYADLASNMSDSLTVIPNAWTGGTFYAPLSPMPVPGGGPGEPVPEPTSAMMILLGLAGLALKRKKV